MGGGKEGQKERHEVVINLEYSVYPIFPSAMIIFKELNYIESNHFFFFFFFFFFLIYGGKSSVTILKQK